MVQINHSLKSDLHGVKSTEVVFEVPLHLTGFFYPIYRETPELTGSLGAGLIISPGLRCFLKRGEGLKFNESTLNTGPAHELYESFGKGLAICLEGNCVPSAGYAFSASSSLAVAACAAIARKIKPSEAAIRAHVAEVNHRTGLGDVAAIWEGFGIAIRKEAGAPTICVVESLQVKEKVAVITSELGKLSTESLLLDYGEKIAAIGKEVFSQFLKEESLENFLTLANIFSRRVGLVEKSLEEYLKPFSSQLLGWYVKKRVLVLVAEESEAPEVAKNISARPQVVRVFRPGEVVWKKYLEAILDTHRS